MLEAIIFAEKNENDQIHFDYFVVGIFQVYRGDLYSELCFCNDIYFCAQYKDDLYLSASGSHFLCSGMVYLFLAVLCLRQFNQLLLCLRQYCHTADHDDLAVFLYLHFPDRCFYEQVFPSCGEGSV